MSTSYRVNSPSVIYERFEDELVAINLNTGVYHSLTGIAADVFQLMVEGATAEEIAEVLTAKYSASSSEILDAVTPFLVQLQREELIAVAEAAPTRGPLKISTDAVGLPLKRPSLEAYRDLQSLFLLDPVHEVGEQGWPQPAPNRTEA
jgi:hypothetical protein